MEKRETQRQKRQSSQSSEVYRAIVETSIGSAPRAGDAEPEGRHDVPETRSSTAR
ncbi:uncharacterized protein TrAtP1_005783 [Trichoderma atroviride]|uniref:uncharacterized protein n=1 Tax=Hypocrea atroviridis TaxID=63577 RepID=UPI003333B65B|nr:hypothetical protein TrAtP1_005783 [Trichoderma atroviride]